MKKTTGLAILLVLLASASPAQLSRYVVTFKHKGATPFTLSNPSPYLSQNAIDRRARFQIQVDSTDLPVPEAYLQQISAIPGVTLLNSSRWLNAASIHVADANAINTINALPFVQSTVALGARAAGRVREKFEETTIDRPGTTARDNGMNGDHYSYGTDSYAEIHLHRGEFLHNIGLRGQGMQIAMLDGGFYNYTTLPAFDSMNLHNQVLSTWDFVSRHAGVSEDHPHGMQCLSTIAANIPGEFIGKAPKAMFHLYRTEDAASEYPIEEFNWACGAEKADSIGADIISSSLGYGYEFNDPVPDYPFSDLNGDITMSARAADLAARKGLLVFNSAGNSGNDYWKRITTPADGDSVVAVGAVTSGGIVPAFTSYGPSADGRVKPDVASVGASALVQTTGGTVAFNNGTSFAAPNMAGLAACLWQGFPEFNNMRIVRALKEAGSRYNDPNDRIGYGIPNMQDAFKALLSEFATLSADACNCRITLEWTSKDVSGMLYEIEAKLPTDLNYSKIASMDPVTGNILSNHSYQYEYTLPSGLTGLFSFRVRQLLDTNSTAPVSIYIDTVDVNIVNPCQQITVNRIIIAPNPVPGNATVMVETDNAVERLTIIVYDMKGSVMMKKNGSKTNGRALFDLSTHHLPKGKYIVSVFDNNTAIGHADLLKL